MDNHGVSPFSFAEILEHCIEPTVKDAFSHIGKLIFWCMIFRILTQSGLSDESLYCASKLPTFLFLGSLHKGISVHFVSFSIGLLVASHFFYLNTAFMVIFAISAYFILKVLQRFVGAHRGVALAAFCFMFNTFWYVRTTPLILLFKI